MKPTKYIIALDKTEVEAYQALVDNWSSWPQQGVGLDGRQKGSSVPGSDGWTMHEFDIVEHPGGGQWAHPSIDPNENPSKNGKLTKEQKDLLKDLLKEAKKGEVDLPADWTPEDPLP